MNVILGLNAFHADSSACLLVDGELVGAIAEERLGQRKKHTSDFPINAIEFVLKSANLKLSDVSHIAIARDTSNAMRQRIKYGLKNPVRSLGAGLEFVRRSLVQDSISSRLTRDPSLGIFNGTIVGVEHHLAHICSAYFASDFEDAAGLSYDASGDFVSFMVARCRGTNIEILDRVYLPHSLGIFYTAMTQFVGFSGFGDEFKFMGMAAYGENSYEEQIKRLVKFDEDGWFNINPKYFAMHQGGQSGKQAENGKVVVDPLYTNALSSMFPSFARDVTEISEVQADIARSVQVGFENVITKCARKLKTLTGAKNLVTAGGCALNGLANTRIATEAGFHSQFIQPAASDDGTALGAAYYVYNAITPEPKREKMFPSVYLGGEYLDELDITSSANVSTTRFDNDDEVYDAVVKKLANNQIVGWFQGRSEWGPRALGNRSILANPACKDMKAILNGKIKRRESFRPFAPSVLDEYKSTYFATNLRSDYMMHVVQVNEGWKNRLPAITHVDGTARMQTVTKDLNERYYSLIKKFGDRTGVYMLLNTSFNENEPVVETPDQAFACFMRTDMDALCIGNVIYSKK